MKAGKKGFATYLVLLTLFAGVMFLSVFTAFQTIFQQLHYERGLRKAMDNHALIAERQLVFLRSRIERYPYVGATAIPANVSQDLSSYLSGGAISTLDANTLRYIRNLLDQGCFASSSRFGNERFIVGVSYLVWDTENYQPPCGTYPLPPGVPSSARNYLFTREDSFRWLRPSPALSLSTSVPSLWYLSKREVPLFYGGTVLRSDGYPVERRYFRRLETVYFYNLLDRTFGGTYAIPFPISLYIGSGLDRNGQRFTFQTGDVFDVPVYTAGVASFSGTPHFLGPVALLRCQSFSGTGASSTCTSPYGPIWLGGQAYDPESFPDPFAPCVSGNCPNFAHGLFLYPHPIAPEALFALSESQLANPSPFSVYTAQSGYQVRISGNTAEIWANVDDSDPTNDYRVTTLSGPHIIRSSGHLSVKALDPRTHAIGDTTTFWVVADGNIEVRSSLFADRPACDRPPGVSPDGQTPYPASCGYRNAYAIDVLGLWSRNGDVIVRPDPVNSGSGVPEPPRSVTLENVVIMASRGAFWADPSRAHTGGSELYVIGRIAVNRFGPFEDGRRRWLLRFGGDYRIPTVSSSNTTNAQRLFKLWPGGVTHPYPAPLDKRVIGISFPFAK